MAGQDERPDDDHDIEFDLHYRSRRRAVSVGLMALLGGAIAAAVILLVRWWVI